MVTTTMPQPSTPAQTFPNQTLSDFLQSMHRRIEAATPNQSLQPFAEPSLSWQNLADILQTATAYE